MNDTPPRIARLALYVACAALVGCASTLPHPALPASTPIAVVPARTAPLVDFNVYARGKGAAAGELGARTAGGGALAGAVLPIYMGPVGIVGYPIIAPYTVLAGALVGATLGTGDGLLHGLSDEQAQRLAAVAEQAVRDLAVHDQVAARVVTLAASEHRRAELIADAGPQRADERPDYAALRSRYGAVLELTVSDIRMVALKHAPPRVALEMRLRARVVCLNADCVDGELQLAWNGPPRPVAQWTAGRAELLAQEFALGYQNLAVQAWERFTPAPPTEAPR